MKTPIVYALVASPKDYFLQEIWASVYSLRLYEQDRDVHICCDNDTASYIKCFPDFTKIVTEIITIPIPDNLNSKQKSREIKTTTRKYIRGKFLFVDTDTIFTGSLNEIDTISYDIAAVPEFHVSLNGSLFRNNIISNVKNIFDVDISDAERWHNSGVMYVDDTPITHQFYERWNANWKFSAFERGNSQDQPSLIKTDKEFGYIIKELPGEFNCQLCMSVKHFANAKIIHFLHFGLLPKIHNPFYDKRIYQQIKEDGGITQETKEAIEQCKSLIDSTSCIIEGETIKFLLSNPGHIFLSIFKEGGWKLSLMNKIAVLFQKILK